MFSRFWHTVLWYVICLVPRYKLLLYLSFLFLSQVSFLFSLFLLTLIASATLFSLPFAPLVLFSFSTNRAKNLALVEYSSCGFCILTFFQWYCLFIHNFLQFHDKSSGVQIDCKACLLIVQFHWLQWHYHLQWCCHLWDLELH